MDGLDLRAFALLDAEIKRLEQAELNNLVEIPDPEMYPKRIGTIGAYRQVQSAMRDIAKKLNGGQG